LHADLYFAPAKAICIPGNNAPQDAAYYFWNSARRRLPGSNNSTGRQREDFLRPNLVYLRKLSLSLSLCLWKEIDRRTRD